MDLEKHKKGGRRRWFVLVNVILWKTYDSVIFVVIALFIGETPVQFLFWYKLFLLEIFGYSAISKDAAENFID